MTYKSTSRFPLEVEDKSVKDFTQRKKILFSFLSKYHNFKEANT